MVMVMLDIVATIIDVIIILVCETRIDLHFVEQILNDDSRLMFHHDLFGLVIKLLEQHIPIIYEWLINLAGDLLRTQLRTRISLL